MIDSEEEHLYQFSGRLNGKWDGSYLRTELLLMILRGEVDFETAVLRCDLQRSACISELPHIVGCEAVATFERVRASTAAVRKRYLNRQISSSDYLAARNATLASYGVGTRALCEARLLELLPHDSTGMLPLSRRVEIFAEVVREKIASNTRRERQRAAASRMHVEDLYRKRATHRSGAVPKQLPGRAYVAALLCGLGLLADVGAPVGFNGVARVTSDQITTAIVVGLMSVCARGPLLAAIITRNPHWRSRAGFTILALALIATGGGLLIGTQLEGPDTPVVAGFVVMAVVVRIGWLGFWAFYLGLFATHVDD